MADRFWSSEEYDERAHDYYNDGDYDEALETLKEGLALYPNAVELYVGLGHARLAREEFAWARHAFERAIVLDPAHEDALVGMGEVLLRLGRTNEALSLFDEVEAAGFEDDVDVMLTIGRALYRQQLYRHARRVFVRLAAARPDSADAVASVGYVLHRMGEEVEATRHLRRALRLDPDLYEARTYLGHLLYDRGDWDGAMREFERVPPSEHWDSLAVWRVIELKESFARIPEDDVSITPWHRRLDQLEAIEWDPVEQLLVEIEMAAAGSFPVGPQDESQLELFMGSSSDTTPPPTIHVRLPGGQMIRGGNYQDVVIQFRDHMGFSHEPLGSFMRRMAERWHEQFGIEITAIDPEAFVRSAGGFGLLNVMEY